MNATDRAKDLLQRCNLRITPMRVQVLEEFIDAGNNALSSQSIEQQIDQIDRITLYRTLKTFNDAGLIHQAMDGSGKVKYALCSDDCSTHHHHVDQHAHFYCSECERTLCLEATAFPEVNLPSNYLLDNCQLVLSGICSDCNSSS